MGKDAGDVELQERERHAVPAAGLVLTNDGYYVHTHIYIYIYIHMYICISTHTHIHIMFVIILYYIALSCPPSRGGRRRRPAPWRPPGGSCLRTLGGTTCLTLLV